MEISKEIKPMNPELKSLLLQKAKELLPSIIELRRHLHQHPELSFQEFETSKFIKDFLTRHQIEFEANWVRTGLVASIGETKGNPCFALRADMDALPIVEQNTVDYTSANHGVMHACGHDVHTSCLIGALLILKTFERELAQPVIGIFQPGEEKLPGGASLMISEGLFDQYQISKIIGLHVQPTMKAGELGFCPGQSMASSDELYITVKGKGGHAAMPHLAVDPIVATARLITTLQELVSRNNNPFSPSVLTIGKVNTVGGATNVIPDEVKLEGTFRAMDETWRARAHELIQKICYETAQANGCEAIVDIRIGYPCLVNDKVFTAQCKSVAEDLWDDALVKDFPARMTSEDFAYYLQKVPGCFFRLGTSSVDGSKSNSVHTPQFDIDEQALFTGMASLSWMALNVK